MRSGDRAALETGRGIADGFHDRGKTFQFGTPFPHCHQSLFLRSLAEKGRRRMNFFNVPTDRRYFAYSGAVFQHQGRHDAARVDRAVGIGMLLAFAKIDCDEGNRDPLFGEEYTHAPRIG
jgi:hypothetical protein